MNDKELLLTDEEIKAVYKREGFYCFSHNLIEDKPKLQAQHEKTSKGLKAHYEPLIKQALELVKLARQEIVIENAIVKKHIKILNENNNKLEALKKKIEERK